MKNLHFIRILFLSVIVLSCNKDDNNDNPPAEESAFQATINGGTFSNYALTLGVYQITKGTNGNTLSIDIGDINGNMINLFLNGNGGFGTGVVKQMGDIDSNNFMNNVVIRQQQQATYYSSGGNVTITKNREHPTESGKRLISGTFTINASSIDGTQSTSMSGSFTELEYVD
ncbi:MAG: hypothetical protein ABIO60_12155 [Aquaticitalea sp.]